jgi:hypothetical protein
LPHFSSDARTVKHRLISGKPSRLSAKGNPEGSPSDPVTTDPKGEACRAAVEPRIQAARNTPALIEDKAAYGDRPLDPWYVTGLVEGEGCFCVSFSRRRKLRLALEVRPSFSLSLNEKDRALLEDLQMFLGCGSLRESRRDRTVKYESRSTHELVEHVVPHFERFPLRGSKARSFEGFSTICRMVEQGDHLERPGLTAIVQIAYEINLGKRKHDESDLLRALDEVKG